MAEQIELKLFTISDLKQYFIHNQAVDLLSDEVITYPRAIATIHNPYVTDDMAVVSALFVNRKVAAYTYVFPDKLTRPDKLIYWNTVIYVDKQYEGRGFACVVIGQMAELYGPDYFDLDAVPASQENLRFVGLQVDYVDQYFLEQKHINISSLYGKCARIVERIRLACVSRIRCLQNTIQSKDYTIQYVNYIDDKTYDFIQSHSQNDLFLRSQDMFNWILTYPLAIESPIAYRVEATCHFSTITPIFKHYAVQVWHCEQLIGFYILRDSIKETYLEYLYLEEKFSPLVYASVAEHILQFDRNRFFTANKQFVMWLNEYRLYAHFGVYHKSFSHPLDYSMVEGQFIQAGDGDNMI